MITTRHKLTRYGGSLAMVLVVHAIAIVLTLNWSVPQAIELPPAAMMIEMAPMPEPAPPPPPKVVTPPQPPAEVEAPPLPKVAEAPKPKIAIAKPVKPKAKPQPPKPEKKPEPPQEKPTDQETLDTPPSNAPAQKSAAPAPSIATNSNALPTWQSDLLRHLGKYKRYPEDARRRGLQGINRLRFVVDGEGKILSYSLAGGSGSAALDRATLEMIRKAQPVPAPPKELLNNGSIEVVAPFVYSLDKR
ncbi:energy transducer TonB [Pseudomonas sp. SDI]|uniref:energy transducer TonB n=1 Tax=Pseudomonas sp. SDI TaxID=2170734 RepID=UPI000DE75352|nr:energy transducer TonB [Pseudomonas sp. SDI]PWB30316.1 energy transducer TonB [Pseudomonas sp. SDI]